MLKIGVIGAGHLGKIHIKLIKESNDEYELVGFYDVNPENAQKVAKEWPTQNSAKDPQMIWPPVTKAVQVTTSARSTDIAAEVVYY